MERYTIDDIEITISEPTQVDVQASAAQARACQAVDRACRLAQWVATERPRVTTTGMPTPTTAPAAAAALGLRPPSKVRRAADLPQLARPWSVAVAADLITVVGGRAGAGPALAGWPTASDETVLAAWLAGLRAVCAAESERRRDGHVSGVAMVVLWLLTNDTPPQPGRGLKHAVYSVVCSDDDLYERIDISALSRWLATEQEGGGEWRLFTLLESFGALAGSPEVPLITPLGRWLLAQLAADLADRIEPTDDVRDVLSRLVGCDSTARWRNAQRWMAGRPPLEAARALLSAASGAAPEERLAAVQVLDDLGEEVLPAWREVIGDPDVGPHARAVLALWDESPEPTPADRRWLRVDRAAAALTGLGPDEALSVLVDAEPKLDLEATIAQLREDVHPHASTLARALGEFVASGAPRSVDQTLQLRVSLIGSRPEIWRRAVMPATDSLHDLHRVIQVLFGWGGDHLHAFTVGKQRYCDPFYRLEECEDEYELRLAHAFTGKTRVLEYTYDFGADWRHAVRLEKVLTRDPDLEMPRCVDFAENSPVEYWSEEDDDDPEDREPFDVERVNRRLVSGAGWDVDDADADWDDADADNDEWPSPEEIEK